MKKRFFALGLTIYLFCLCISAYAIEPRATTKPTSYAPTSWYNTWHDWSAKNYTYSKYFFNSKSTPVIECTKEFTVKYYDTKGNLLEERAAGWNIEWDSYLAEGFYSDVDYYFVIYNDSDSSITTADASYVIWLYS